MKVLTLSREYPPNVYGGAGVHVEHLTREMAKLIEVEVRCFGEQSVSAGNGRPAVQGFQGWPQLGRHGDPKLRRIFETLSAGLAMTAAGTDADVVHCHTWYSMAAGLWVKILHDIPLVVTVHSLEPLRPWKEEQLGRGYRLSSWMERTAIEAADAVIAVSEGTRREVLDCYGVDPERVKVIYNGIDEDVFQPTSPAAVLKRHGIDPHQPYLLFVGRITRQKGLPHLLRAIREIDAGVQAVICAAAPDTPELGREVEQAIRELQRTRGGVTWLADVVAVADLVALYSGATVFVCPSVYEPFGIINLEAMAVGCPVVASGVGGIPEVVINNETGVIVPFDSRGGTDFEPRDPEQFAADLAAAVNQLAKDPSRREAMGKAGRRRVSEQFTWRRIAAQTVDLYASLVGKTVT